MRDIQKRLQRRQVERIDNLTPIQLKAMITLYPSELHQIVQGSADGAWPYYHMRYNRLALTSDETVDLTSTINQDSEKYKRFVEEEIEKDQIDDLSDEELFVYYRFVDFTRGSLGVQIYAERQVFERYKSYLRGELSWLNLLIGINQKQYYRMKKLREKYPKSMFLWYSLLKCGKLVNGEYYDWEFRDQENDI